ncbi:MAG TPA: hypothetical protein DEQ61_08340 [Streptomyces sp.]|nr:hypothetical protein [Streptomyces sp.]
MIPIDPLHLGIAIGSSGTAGLLAGLACAWHAWSDHRRATAAARHDARIAETQAHTGLDDAQPGTSTALLADCEQIWHRSNGTEWRNQ